MPQTNRHPVDELVDVKARIAELTKREKALKEQVIEMIGDRDAVGGDENIATVALQSRKSLDRKGLEKRFGKDVIAGFDRESVPFYVVRTTPRVADAA
ncbi:hypothetical protein SAMN06297251_10297 [Fulvimarina manganoxydans]|uniref:Uncharacterized protein n=1 Tax=Fulvimarina manganoxydans TaxID=937218 RepID=A0A1W1Z037_9HYPH|nr:hypothetical protein [Fulvimarina manganoxydans]SMC41318.1 hypothetical protein SAMN06297251_10297 [Fulvimarina manganoxydans]